MTTLLFAALLDPTKAAVAPTAPTLDVTIPAVPAQRASGPLRKHKRKSQPQRSALDSAWSSEEPTTSESEGSRRKERRHSASPPAVEQQACRSRPQRAVAANQAFLPPALPDFVAPAPEQLAAVFEGTASPPFLACATAAGAPKTCVQCGTTNTPMWRSVNGLTYCNADGLRLKRRLGLL